MKDQMYKYKMQNHRRGEETAKKDVRATGRAQSKYEQSRKISYCIIVLLHEHHMQQDYSALQGTGPHTAGGLDLVLHGLKKSNKNKRDLDNVINQK